MIKNTQKLALLIGALTAIAFTENAQAAASGTTFTVSPAVVSNYMFRGMKLAELSVQGTVEMATEDFALGVWANQPVDEDAFGNADPEIDVYVNKTYKLNDALSLVPAVTMYYYPKADNSVAFSYTFEPSIALNYTMSGFKITPKLYYDVRTLQYTAELTGTYALPLEAWGTELNLTGQVGDYLAKKAFKSPAGDPHAWGSYFMVGVSAPFKLSDTSSVTVGLNYSWGQGGKVQVPGSAKFSNPYETAAWVLSGTYSFGL